MFTVAFERYTLLCLPDGLPDQYADYAGHSRLADEVNLSSPEGKACFVAVREGMGWPFLVVAQRYWPAEGGFYPGAVIIPETGLLFLGAGERLLAYQLDPPARLWEDRADMGFWAWQRHGQFVLMSAELELAAWDLSGRKVWTTFVEPPWGCKVGGGVVHLDVMGRQSSFPLTTGPVQ